MMPTRLAASLLALSASCWAVSAHAAPEPSQPLPPTAGAKAGSTGGEAAFVQAVQAMQARQFPEAKRLFNEQLKADPRHMPSLLGLAELAFQSGAPEDAKAWLSKAQAVDPNHVPLLVALGRYYLIRGQADKAETVLVRAAEADPKNLMALMNLSEAHSRQGAFDKAAKRLRQAVALEPKVAKTHLLLGVTLLRMRQDAEGQASLKRAAELSPTDPDPLMELAQAQKTAAAATPYIDQVLKLNPKHYEAQLLRAVWQLRGKDVAAGRKSLEQLTKDHPKAGEPWVQLGMLAHADKRLPDARAAYKAALERQPNHPVALNNLAAMMLAANENPSDAETLVRRALKVMPNNAQLHDTLAAALVARKDAKAALVAIQTAVNLDARDAGIQLRWAEIRLLNGDKNGARRTAEALKGTAGVDAARLQAVLQQAG